MGRRYLGPLYDILLQRADNSHEFFLFLSGDLEFFQGGFQMPRDDIEFLLGNTHSVMRVFHIPTWVFTGSSSGHTDQFRSQLGKEVNSLVESFGFYQQLMAE